MEQQAPSVNELVSVKMPTLQSKEGGPFDEAPCSCFDLPAKRASRASLDQQSAAEGLKFTKSFYQAWSSDGCVVGCRDDAAVFSSTRQGAKKGDKEFGCKKRA